MNLNGFADDGATVPALRGAARLDCLGGGGIMAAIPSPGPSAWILCY